jgi:hypothetical protein
VRLSGHRSYVEAPASDIENPPFGRADRRAGPAAAIGDGGAPAMRRVYSFARRVLEAEVKTNVALDGPWR